MPIRQRRSDRDDSCQRAPRHDQAAIRPACEGRKRTLNLGRVGHVDRAHLDPERRRHGLDRAELTDPSGQGGSRMTAMRVTPGAISLSTSSHFPLMPYSKLVKPVALPPGRARLSTNPAPTGSNTFVNTIGTKRVACNNGPVEKLAVT